MNTEMSVGIITNTTNGVLKMGSSVPGKGAVLNRKHLFAEGADVLLQRISPEEGGGSGDEDVGSGFFHPDGIGDAYVAVHLDLRIWAAVFV